MKKIVSLTKVFIKEFYQNLPIFDKEKRKFNKKSILYWLIMIVFLGMTYVSYEMIIFFKNSGQPQIFLNLFFFILPILLLFQAILVSSNIFFFSKDIENVLHMPLKSTELLLAKFNTLVCMLYVVEGIFGLVPLTFYGLLNNSHFLFYLWEIIILAIFPILLAVCVSIIILCIMRFAKFIKNKDILQLAITIIMILLFCILETKLLGGLFGAENEEQAIQQFTTFSQKAEEMGKYFLIVNPSVAILTNPASIIAVLLFFQLIGYDIIGGIIFIAIGRITYLKDILENIVNTTNKKTKNINSKKDIKKRSIRKSYIIKELKMLIREPIFFMECVFPVMIMLFSSITLLIVLIPIIAQVTQDDTIKQMIQNLSFNEEVVCDILIVMQVLFAMSNISLTAISREGKNAVFTKYIPVELYKQFVYKNAPQIMLNFLVSMIILGIIWYFIPSINMLYLLMILLIATLINFINSYLALIVDLRRPNLDWDTQYSVVKKSDNKFFQYAFMIINILFLMYLANIFKNINLLIALIGEAVIFAIIFIIIDRCVKKWQNKLFNKII